MKNRETVAVIGLGLIGGSVARALAANGVRVIAYDRDRSAVAAAILDGVVKSEISESLTECAEAGSIVISLPGDAARELIPRIGSASTSAALVMDVGSTKQLVVNAAEAAGIGSRFVGSHPLAGDHRSGWGSSRADMFKGQPVYLCATSTTTPEALAAARRFWIALGACPVSADASAHDSRMAWVSHLPHVLSSALALTLREAGIARKELGPGGCDMTRLAGSSPEMWSAIAGENAAAIEAAISAFERNLSELRAGVSSANIESFRARFSEGREWFREG